MNEKIISMYDLVISITNLSDIINSRITNHNKQVAYLAYRIAQSYGLSVGQQRDIFLAGLLHDIGAFATNERLELLHTEPDNMHEHAFIGASALEAFEPLKVESEIIRYHHVPWNNGQGKRFLGKDVPVSSHIIHLADRIAVLIDVRRNVIGQIKDICGEIEQQSNKVFMPEPVSAFLEISHQECVWLDTIYNPLLTILPSMMIFDTMELTLEQVIELTEIFANLIDFRSPFTAKHSLGVAAVAEKLAEQLGFSENECKMMLVAGNLHDLGKLAVSNEILEKTDTLGVEEFNQIRSHTFYTYRTLQPIKGFETINTWASLHHERLNGTGYPFHLKSEEIPLGSRVMAVADVFTAITEDRPYRNGMEKAQVLRVIGDMVSNGSLCPYVAAALTDNYDFMDQTRITAQGRAAERFRTVGDIRRALERMLPA